MKNQTFMVLDLFLKKKNRQKFKSLSVPVTEEVSPTVKGNTGISIFKYRKSSNIYFIFSETTSGHIDCKIYISNL